MDSALLNDESAQQYLDRRLQENDVKGAIEFAIKEQNRFPKLNRLIRFLGNITVQVSPADVEVDWYSVLGVDSSADIKTMKQQYMQLAKDNQLRSKEVHKLLNKAWDTLSNKFSRRDYDIRRKSRQVQPDAFVVKQASSSTQLLQPAPVLHDSSGNKQSSPRPVDSAQAVQMAPDLYNVSENDGRHLTSIPTVTNSTQPIPHVYNLSGNKEPGPRSVSTDTPLIQPALGMHSISGNNRSGLTVIPSDPHLILPQQGQSNIPGNGGSAPNLVPSATQSIHQRPGMYNVSGNVGIGPRLVFSAEESIQPGSGMDNAAGNSRSGPGSISSAQPSILAAPRLYNVWKKIKSNLSSASPSSRSFDPPPGLSSGSGNNPSGLTEVSNAQLFHSAHVNLKRRYEGEDLTSSTSVKVPRTQFKESGICLPPVAGPISTHIKHEKGLSLVEDTGDSSKNVSANNMPAESNGQKGVENEKVIPGVQRETEKVGGSGSKKGNSKKKLADVERNILMEMARNVIINKLKECNASASDNNEHKTADVIEEAATEGPNDDVLKTMEVPDSDFHDFDNDRTKESFAENQVWAVYDEDDGMPRLYALIRKASRRSSKLQVSWLNSAGNMEAELLKWIDSGFHQTCGDFCIQKKQISINLNSFSHRVTGWTKKANLFQIFPKKGDVWALYKNWSPEWNKHTTEEEKHKYEMVEVLSDYDESKGVTIVPLVKVAGLKAVFCKNSDEKEVRMVPKEEIFRFSHQVSSYLLTDQEATNLPNGSKELDPAALPLELLQVIH
ncbi:hypothetical protein DCAR_0206462 [Daucus carota subsp. sativus]|uniref:J domain-containing protein n=1 Tax=Daucus carota subsp. sativus TaxID=79200 RepID=A0AAF1AL53_DAUCS|nr:PREDICTED: uncharacterized protein LOC108207404 [Daucus carota subsp. sativus]WOG87239.1 hypothetical protein DCAR_0206462 [Daucus carota subsp. sativus]